MAVLSVDLATRRWSDLGIVVLDRVAASSEGLVQCEIICWNDAGRVEAEILAGRLNHLCGVRGIRVLLLDGPQAWKSSSNGLVHCTRLAKHTVDGGLGEWVGYFSLLAAYVAGVSCSRL